MNILVTGGAGFVGSNLIKQLTIDGHYVESLDNYSSGHKRNEHFQCQYRHFDIKDSFDLINFTRKPDVIFHLAAQARIQPSFKNPKDTLDDNILGTMNVLELARKKKIQVIYSGSSSRHYNLYGSPYALSKNVGEELCRMYAKVYGVNASICRFYNVYGEGQITYGKYATVIGLFQHQHLRCQSLTIVGDGEQSRDFTHIDDIVDGLIKCMNVYSGDCVGETLELGSGKAYTINEVAKMFLNKFNDKTVEYLPERKGEYPSTLCDISKASLRINYKPKVDLKDYIKNWLEINGKKFVY